MRMMGSGGIKKPAFVGPAILPGTTRAPEARGREDYLAFLKVLFTSTSTLAWGAWHWVQTQRPI